jgi:RHS repeat-associated protein
MDGGTSQSSAVIALPQGGGALQGIGEKFSPDLHTGTGNFTVPIAVPAGRGGLQPELTLTYSTGHGNGPFGLGWSLSIPGVTRQTAKGIPRYDDARDTFILSGAEDLVAVPGAPAGATRYRPRTEGLFARIEHHRDDAQDCWQARSQDGVLSVYGTPAAAAGDDPAVVADPENRAKVCGWKLSQTRDTFGNRIEYEYERDLGVEGPHRFDQLYLKRIRYADYAESRPDQFLVSVNFVYDERPDAFSEYRHGFEVRTRRRCVRIETHTHAGEDRLVRTCQFIYLDQRAGLESARPPNGVSLLSQIKVAGHDGDLTEELPPLEFGYTRFEAGMRRFTRIAGADLPAVSLANPDYELTDLFGHGLPDILEMNGTVRYWRNLGGGRFDRPREMAQAPAGLRLAARGVQLLDADGDARADLMVVTEESAGYFPLRFDGSWDRRSFQRYRQAPSFDLQDAEVRLLDLTGDGVTDAMRSGARLECFFNDPKEGWNETRRVERRALDAFPNVSFSDPRVKLADMTGDGLQDVVLIYDGSIEYWPNLGRGNWGRRVSMRHSPRLPEDFDPRRVLVGDVDGDGVADVMYVEDGRLTLWINQSGNGWSDPTVIRGTPRVSDLDSVRVADVLGVGVGGVLWTADAMDAARANMFFLDFTGGTKPYLLDQMDNHIGAHTRLAYAPSTRFRLQDEQHPATRWKTPLPFPVHVVARVEVIDEISGGKRTTEYSYHHGYWDGAEREFRGFGRVDQRDTETFENFHARSVHGGRAFEAVDAGAFSPPVETRTWFHQGPVGDEFGGWEESDYSAEYWSGDPQVLARPPAMTAALSALPRRARRDALRALRGGVLRTELYARDGSDRQDRPYTVTEGSSGVREESPPGVGEGERLRIFFPHVLAQRTTQWERGDDPMTRFQFVGDYDGYGRPRTETGIAVPRRRDFRVAAPPGDPYLATHTVTDFAHRDDGEHYLIGRTARVTGYEVVNDGSRSVPALRDGISDGTAPRKIISQTVVFYDGPAFEGLPFGQLGVHGVATRRENLVMTEETLRAACMNGGAAPAPPEIPPYLAPDGPAAWTAEYPPEFRDLLPPRAGYVFQSGGAGSPHARGYFAATERKRYDVQENQGGEGRGLLRASRDALGRDTTTSYDVFDLLPTETTNPAGLVLEKAYDPRLLVPREMTDPNGNRTVWAFSPLGMLASTARIGKEGANEGDSTEVPGTRLVYDFLAFVQRGQPISVRTIRRVHHAGDTAVPLPQRDETMEAVEYSDGFGRLLQTRSQADDVSFGGDSFGDAGLPSEASVPVGDAVGRRRDPGAAPRVSVSGWQIFDNKGRVVEKYEPFFSHGWDYSAPSEGQLGEKARLSYDPRGRVLRTVNPDGSEQRVVFGVPDDLGNPERLAPAPWEAFTYDANDNAGRTHPGAAAGYQHHWNTPASVTVDALGRGIAGVTRNGPDAASDWFVTRSTYDIRGNLLTVTDALGRVALQHAYDLTDRPWRVESIDAGVRRTVLDAAGNPLEARDSKGALLLRGHDVLNRPIRLWARDGAGQALTQRERMVYGDAADSGVERPQAAALNLLDKPFRHYDEAGLLTFDTYDFKGNLRERTRRVIGDAAVMTVFDPPPADWRTPVFRVDWQPPAAVTLDSHARGLLAAEPYRTTIAYDALDRVRTMRYPQDVEGERRELRPHYDRAGALERVELDGATFVDRIAYNAKGQRTLIAYGNGLMTRYAYDPRSFLLVRLRTERFIQPEALTYRPSGVPFQDFAYECDLAGNVTLIRDRAPESGVPNTMLGGGALDRVFAYDPLYRLQSATGRECDVPPGEPWDGAPRCADLTRTRAWTERYHYDAAGNMTRLQHQANGGGFLRDLALAPGSNRLAAMTVGQSAFNYHYDPTGNLLSESASRHFEWDHGDRMRVYRTQTGTAEPSVHAHYLYDAGGQRVKKLVRKQGGQLETTVYVEGIFEHHRVVQAGAAREHDTLHVMDDQSRIALIRVGAPFPHDTTPAVQFHLGDHLGSSHVVLDDTGGFVNREEYTPYGETSFGSFARKRYRFTGKERDEESGLNYHGARYYAPWLCRWTSCDPEGMNIPRGTLASAPFVPSVPWRDLPRSRQRQLHWTSREPVGTPGERPRGIHPGVVATVPRAETPERESQTRSPAAGFDPIRLDGDAAVSTGMALYTYVLDNPLRFVDQDGEAPSIASAVGDWLKSKWKDIIIAGAEVAVNDTGDKPPPPLPPQPPAHVAPPPPEPTPPAGIDPDSYKWLVPIVLIPVLTEALKTLTEVPAAGLGPIVVPPNYFESMHEEAGPI